mgnify:CR=1 FL=1
MGTENEVTIETIEALPGKGPAGGRVRIRFTGGEALDLPRDLVLVLGWGPGDRIPSREAERARKRGEALEAREQALRLLDHQSRTRRELQSRLEQAGHSPRAVRFALFWCTARGFLDDRRFAQSWVISRLTRPEYGSFRICHELIQRGVDPALAKAVVEEALPPEEELERAVAAGRRRLGARLGSGEPLSLNESARLIRYLAGRGFPYGIARQAVARLGGEILPDEAP